MIRSSRRWWRSPVLLAVLAALALGTLVAAVMLIRPTGQPDAGAPGASPSGAATLPPVPSPSPVLPAASGRPVDPAGLALALAEMAKDPALGESVGISVLDALTGDELFGRDATRAHAPASTLKLLTGAAALRILGPEHRLSTRVVSGGPGVLVVVGGGDATLVGSAIEADVWPRPASLPELARVTASALRSGAGAAPSPGPQPSPSAGAGAIQVRVDDSLFGGPATAPEWEPDYVSSGVVSPVQALSVDGGRTAPRDRNGIAPRASDPALAAGERFAALLGAEGITVEGDVSRAVAPAQARELAQVSSAPVAALVESMLASSDDDLAEALGHLVGAAEGAEGTFERAAAATRSALADLGLPVVGVSLLDASGLARDNAVPAQTFTGLLVAAASPEHPELRALLTGLPVAGWSGTLADRFGAGAAVTDAAVAAAEGRVRAKTGTLTGVSALAGTVLDADGRLLVFAALADQVPPGVGTLEARAALDRLAARLAGCGCRPLLPPPTGQPSAPPSGPPSAPPSGQPLAPSSDQPTLLPSAALSRSVVPSSP